MSTRTRRTSAARSYDRISQAYELIADAAEHAARDRGLEMLRVKPGDRVLEIGAGTGRALVQMRREAGKAGAVVGLDVSSGMLRLARARLKSRMGAHLIRADGRDIPCRDAWFDVAFMSFTLELFEREDIGVVLGEVARVLRPNGRLGIVALGSTAQPGLMTQGYSWLHRHFPHFIDCRPIDLATEFRRHAFSATESEEVSLWGLPVTIAVGSMAGNDP